MKKIITKNDFKKMVILNILIAVFKGVAHSFLIPTIIVITVNENFDGNWGYFVAFVYVAIFTLFYLTSKNKDISKYSFLVVIGIYALLLIGRVVTAAAWGFAW